MKKIFILLFSCFFLTGCFSKTMAMPKDILEEAIPIRENDRIVGMNYMITIPKDYPLKNRISTHIVDSIVHYKDLDNLESFPVSVLLKNEMDDDFELVEVSIEKEQIVLKSFSYDLLFYHHEAKSFSFFVDNSLTKDCQVVLKLNK